MLVCIALASAAASAGKPAGARQWASAGQGVVAGDFAGRAYARIRTKVWQWHGNRESQARMLRLERIGDRFRLTRRQRLGDATMEGDVVATTVRPGATALTVRFSGADQARLAFPKTRRPSPLYPVALNDPSGLATFTFDDAGGVAIHAITRYQRGPIGDFVDKTFVPNTLREAITPKTLVERWHARMEPPAPWQRRLYVADE